ncbi:MAG: hypothetical protein LBQ89_09095 [Treponema sp.]|nr:hypothetical protein [Treponema sp.]
MGNGNLDRYKPIKTALKRVGFKVEKIEKQGKKTVITVFRCEQSRCEHNDKNMAAPGEQGKSEL